MVETVRDLVIVYEKKTGFHFYSTIANEIKEKGGHPYGFVRQSCCLKPSEPMNSAMPYIVNWPECQVYKYEQLLC